MNRVGIAGIIVVLAALMVGCASDKTSSKPADQPIVIPPIFSDPDQPIEDPGREAVIKDDGTIIIDNEEWGRIAIDENEKYQFVYMIDENGEEKMVGSVYKHIDGTGEYWVFSPNEGGAYYFTRDANGKVIVNWERSIIDGGWGVSPVIPEPAMRELSPEAKAFLKDRSQALKASKAGIKRSK